MQSSHETLSGLDNRCLLRLPDVSAPSLSEASSSPLHASSSPCSAALAGELSVSCWFIVGCRVGRGAGEKEPSLRMARSYSKQLPRHNTPSSSGRSLLPRRPRSAAYGRNPHHRTTPSRESRSLMAGRSNSCLEKYTYPVNSSAVLSKYLSRFLNCDCSVCPTIYPYPLPNNPKCCSNH